MNYETIITETDQAVRAALAHGVVMSWIMLGLLAALAGVFFLLAMGEIKARRAERRAAELQAESIRWERCQRCGADVCDDVCWTRMMPEDQK